MKRLFGQYVSKDVYEQLVANPELARLRRAAAADDRALLRHSRLHDRLRARAARRDRRHAQRVLHAHGRHRVRAQGHARQVRRRHGDGAVRRAARRSASRGACRRRGAGDDSRAESPEREVGGRGTAGARHRHRHQHRADDCGQHRIGGHHELHRDWRRREPGRAARIAQQGVRDPDYHQRGYTRGLAGPIPLSAARRRRGEGQDHAGGDFRGQGEPRHETLDRIIAILAVRARLPTRSSAASCARPRRRRSASSSSTT